MDAVNVKTNPKYTLTFIPTEWDCPHCGAANGNAFTEEEDLCYSDDMICDYIKCANAVVIKASDIFKTE